MTKTNPRMPKLSEADQALWDAYVTKVTPLDSPPVDTPQDMPFAGLRKPVDGVRLDLHGMTVADAYEACTAFLQAANAKHKSVSIITGLGGQIKHEFPFWMEGNSLVRRFDELEGGGAYMVVFKKAV